METKKLEDIIYMRVKNFVKEITTLQDISCENNQNNCIFEDQNFKVHSIMGILYFSSRDRLKEEHIMEPIEKEEEILPKKMSFQKSTIDREKQSHLQKIKEFNLHQQKQAIRQEVLSERQSQCSKVLSQRSKKSNLQQQFDANSNQIHQKQKGQSKIIHYDYKALEKKKKREEKNKEKEILKEKLNEKIISKKEKLKSKEKEKKYKELSKEEKNGEKNKMKTKESLKKFEIRVKKSLKNKKDSFYFVDIEDDDKSMISEKEGQFLDEIEDNQAFSHINTEFDQQQSQSSEQKLQTKSISRKKIIKKKKKRPEPLLQKKTKDPFQFFSKDMTAKVEKMNITVSDEKIKEMLQKMWSQLSEERRNYYIEKSKIE